jgi:hypothetical protein
MSNLTASPGLPERKSAISLLTVRPAAQSLSIFISTQSYAGPLTIVLNTQFQVGMFVEDLLK